MVVMPSLPRLMMISRAVASPDLCVRARLIPLRNYSAVCTSYSVRPGIHLGLEGKHPPSRTSKQVREGRQARRRREEKLAAAPPEPTAGRGCGWFAGLCELPSSSFSSLYRPDPYRDPTGVHVKSGLVSWVYHTKLSGRPEPPPPSAVIFLGVRFFES